MMWFKIKDYFYYLCEHYGGSISCWAWHKRWNKNGWWNRHKSYIDHRKEFPYYPDKK